MTNGRTRLFSLGEISTKSHLSNCDDGDENQRSTTTTANGTQIDNCVDNNVVMEEGVGAVG